MAELIFLFSLSLSLLCSTHAAIEQYNIPPQEDLFSLKDIHDQTLGINGDNELATFDKTEPNFKNMYFHSFCNISQAKGNIWKICRLKYGNTRNLVVMESSKVGGIDEKVITGNEMSEFVFLWSESARTKDYCFIRTLPGLGDMNLQGRIDNTMSHFLYEDRGGSVYESDMWHLPDSHESMLWKIESTGLRSNDGNASSSATNAPISASTIATDTHPENSTRKWKNRQCRARKRY